MLQKETVIPVQFSLYCLINSKKKNGLIRERLKISGWNITINFLCLPY